MSKKKDTVEPEPGATIDVYESVSLRLPQVPAAGGLLWGEPHYKQVATLADLGKFTAAVHSHFGTDTEFVDLVFERNGVTAQFRGEL